MIPTARPTVIFAIFEKYGQTDGQTTYVNLVITIGSLLVGRPSGSIMKTGTADLSLIDYLLLDKRFFSHTIIPVSRNA